MAAQWMHVQIFRYRDLLRLVDNIGDFLFVDNIGDFLSVDNIGDGGSWLIWQMAVCLIIGNCSAASTMLMPNAIQNPPHHLQCPSGTTVKVQAIQNPHNLQKIHPPPAGTKVQVCKSHKSNSVQSASITAKNNSKSTLHLQG